MAFPMKWVAECELRLQVGGQRAFVLVETGSRLRSRRLAQTLRQAGWEARAIVLGQVAVYAVRDSGQGTADFSELEAQLKRRYPMAVCEPGFSESLYRVAKELAQMVEAEFLPVEPCAVCGAPDPFPSVLRVVEASAEKVSVCYCASCVAANQAATYGRLCRALLTAAGSVVGSLQQTRLGRVRREGAILRFPLHHGPLTPAS